MRFWSRTSKDPRSLYRVPRSTRSTVTSGTWHSRGPQGCSQLRYWCTRLGWLSWGATSSDHSTTRTKPGPNTHTKTSILLFPTFNKPTSQLLPNGSRPKHPYTNKSSISPTTPFPTMRSQSWRILLSDHQLSVSFHSPISIFPLRRKCGAIWTWYMRRRGICSRWSGKSW